MEIDCAEIETPSVRRSRRVGLDEFGWRGNGGLVSGWMNTNEIGAWWRDIVG